MRLSLRALELCCTKFGKGSFYGFEQTGESALNGITEEDAAKDFDELLQNGIISVMGDDIHISALGHHIFNMMITPEQCIILDNETIGICVRIYIRNAYYLCVMENKNIESTDSYDRYIFDLLPRLDMIVGAFVYILHNTKNSEKQNVRIIGKAWDEERNVISEFTAEDVICQSGTACCNIDEESNGTKKETEKFEDEVSALINKLTMWMFGNISAIYEKEAS